MALLQVPEFIVDIWGMLTLFHPPVNPCTPFFDENTRDALPHANRRTARQRPHARALHRPARPVRSGIFDAGATPTATRFPGLDLTTPRPGQ